VKEYLLQTKLETNTLWTPNHFGNMQIYRAKQQISIPENVNLTQLLHTNSEKVLPNSQVIAVDNLENREITIGELRSTAGRLAHGLKTDLNPRDQSRWAVILPNGIAFIETVHAVLWLGGVFCPINLDLQPAEIGYALSVSKVDYAIVYHKTVPKILKAFQTAKESDPSFVEPKIVVALGAVRGYETLHADFLSSTSLPIPHHDSTKSRLASIHLSSGTTGKPKGVGLSHYNYVANVLQCHAHDPAHWSPKHSSLIFSPMVHIASTTLPFFLGPYVGMKHVILARFDVKSFCEMVEKHRPVDMMLAKPIIPRLLSGEVQKNYDFSSVKYLVSTGGRRQEVTDALLVAGNWTEIIDLYGMTEAAPYVAWSKIGDKVFMRLLAHSSCTNMMIGPRLRNRIIGAQHGSSIVRR
jgi:acyl-CoA synthetase (AMP-forming)/AMP-acid ligase II